MSAAPVRYRFYITDLFDGMVKGTNSCTAALDFSRIEEFYVVDMGIDGNVPTWLFEGENQPIGEM